MQFLFKPIQNAAKRALTIYSLLAVWLLLEKPGLQIIDICVYRSLAGKVYLFEHFNLTSNAF